MATVQPNPAGYSGTPLHRKLGVKPGHDVALIGAPASFDAAVVNAEGIARVQVWPAGTWPAGTLGAQRFDVLLVFCPDAATLAAALPLAMAATTTAGRCWVAWPKRASGVITDLGEHAVRESGLAAGWVDVKVCAVDEVWSALCLVRRLENR